MHQLMTRASVSVKLLSRGRKREDPGNGVGVKWGRGGGGEGEEGGEPEKTLVNLNNI